MIKWYACTLLTSRALTPTMLGHVARSVCVLYELRVDSPLSGECSFTMTILCARVTFRQAWQHRCRASRPCCPRRSGPRHHPRWSAPPSRALGSRSGGRYRPRSGRIHRHSLHGYAAGQPLRPLPAAARPCEGGAALPTPPARVSGSVRWSWVGG